jgi:glycosyltransferase involved in cell wall biosynthesis
MLVVVTTDAHFYRTPDGRTWIPASFPYRFWRRYLSAFDGVRVVARAREVVEPPPQSQRVDGPNVYFTPVPDYLGPWQYLRNRAAVRRIVQGSLGAHDAVIMRVGSQLANCLYPALKASQRPYGVEVIGDPWDVFAPGVVRHVFRPFLRRHFTRQLRIQCARACGAAYVTERSLQQRYPIVQGAYKTTYSSVDLPKNVAKTVSVGVSDVELPRQRLFSLPRRYEQSDGVFRLVMVGSLAQLYKGVDVAINAVDVCVKGGWNILLTVVGDGKYRAFLQQLATKLGLSQRIIFRGQLPQGSEVNAVLDQNDLFIMPSRTEGLPRAMIEAMARGLPCIASRVGGIPELLPDEDMFPPNDPHALAAKTREVLCDPLRMSQMSARNLKRSMDFREDVLQTRRTEFYHFIRACTEDWIRKQRAA